jgi:hypothetical protein
MRSRVWLSTAVGACLLIGAMTTGCQCCRRQEGGGARAMTIPCGLPRPITILMKQANDQHHPDHQFACRGDVIAFLVINNAGADHDVSIDDTMNGSFLSGGCKTPNHIGNSGNVLLTCTVLTKTADGHYGYALARASLGKGQDPEIEVQGGPGPLDVSPGTGH